MVLPKEWIQTFIAGLQACDIKSEFDRNFLANGNAAVYLYDESQWLALYARRLKAVLLTDFDWTTSNPVHPWHNQDNHANYHWYKMAENISTRSQRHITVYIFSGVEISKNTRRFLNTPKDYTNAYYDDAHKRLLALGIILQFLNNPKNPSNQFSSYEKNGNARALSLGEAAQIQTKQLWSHIQEEMMPTWTDAATKSFDFTEVIYPLYEVVVAYFNLLQSNGSFAELQEALRLLYTNELKSLKVADANRFYGQIIGYDAGKPIYLLDILSKAMCLEALESVFSGMVALAVWITKQKPSMVVNHTDVDLQYRDLEIGPYFTFEKLKKECSVLLTKIRDELREDSEDNIISILAVLDVLDGQVSERVIFDAILKMFRSRDEHNRLATYRDKSDGIATGSYEYTFYREGANKQYMYIAECLSGWGILQRYGIEDLWGLLIRTLTRFHDSISGKPYSKYPAGHLVVHENRTEMIVLQNSVDHYQLERDPNKKFFGLVSSGITVPFTPQQFSDIERYAAKRFKRGYRRLPDFADIKLKASTLKALVNLVNDSLCPDGLKDVYSLRFMQNFPTKYVAKTIYIKAHNNYLEYRVREVWKFDTADAPVYSGKLLFENKLALQSFMKLTLDKRLKHILNQTEPRGHTRPNLTIDQYYNASCAYETFFWVYKQLGKAERERLNRVCVTFGGKTWDFEEIWNGGFPECMSAASKLLSVLVLVYLPDLKYRKGLESDARCQTYLEYARLHGAKLDEKSYIDMDLSLKERDGNTLSKHLTHPSSRRRLSDYIGLSALGFFMNWDDSFSASPKTRCLLRISDSDTENKLRSSTAFSDEDSVTTSVESHSMFSDSSPKLSIKKPYMVEQQRVGPPPVGDEDFSPAITESPIHGAKLDEKSYIDMDLSLKERDGNTFSKHLTHPSSRRCLSDSDTENKLRSSTASSDEDSVTTSVESHSMFSDSPPKLSIKKPYMVEQQRVGPPPLDLPVGDEDFSPAITESPTSSVTDFSLGSSRATSIESDNSGVCNEHIELLLEKEEDTQPRRLGMV
ncbi:MAG: hypothetical protein NXI01_09825 [Gammaproteobacteria bacterium]|nr:hypothetical protein [Gammaproteobacteria bacterium]